MTQSLQLTGYLKDVRYQPFLGASLKEHSFETFDINTVGAFGLLRHDSGNFAYSKWVSPKRTRSYPFERLYNTFDAPNRLTVIPVLKDEGLDGDLDRIQYSTISWMNLLNIYVVLAYYEDARKNVRSAMQSRHKLTAQRFASATVNQQIQEISHYKQSALHWNRSLMERAFVPTYEQAISSYQAISQRTGVPVHSPDSQREYLAQVMQDFEVFKEVSQRGSQRAARREVETRHRREYLSSGAKANLEIQNYLGGIYFLTSDEVMHEKGRVILQESKNSTLAFLPALSDIKDGLFRLILYSNLSELSEGGHPVRFGSRLKLTGRDVHGTLLLPAKPNQVRKFIQANRANIKARHEFLLDRLNLEAANNNLEIAITANQ